MDTKEKTKVFTTIAALLIASAGLVDVATLTPKEAVREVEKVDPKICEPVVTPEYIRICKGVYDPSLDVISDVVITAKDVKRVGVEEITAEINKVLVGGPCDPGVACLQYRLTFNDKTGLFIPEEGGAVQEIIFP
jgi:hypothetical protein